MAEYTRLRDKKTYWAREERETGSDIGRVLEKKGARKGIESAICMRLTILHPGIAHNVFSVHVRAFVPLSAPCGLRVRHPFVFSGTQNCALSCSVRVFLPRVACV